MKSHFFKILRPFLPQHTDIRSELSKMNAKIPFEEWDTKVVKPVEDVVARIFEEQDIEEKDRIIVGPKELWGGHYKTVPYWRCQPYFRPVNGVTADKRVVQALENKINEQSLNSDDNEKKRKAENELEMPAGKELKV